MNKVAVVLRKLDESSPTVVTAVIEPPAEKVDSLENYFDSRFEDVKQDFCNKFVEFRRAEWTMQIVETQR